MHRQRNQDQVPSSSITNLYPHSTTTTTTTTTTHQQSLATRKNACIYYGINCRCSEMQPRRGKNLPEGGLDSRAKKLSPHERDDYEFTLHWLNEYAHEIYRDNYHRIVDLSELKEVSLCKAHSSALYRAKKKHQRNTTTIDQTQAPPSPADSNSTTMMEDVRMTSAYLLPQPSSSSIITGGGLAAKVREISSQYSLMSEQPLLPEPFANTMTVSTSMKRRRTMTHGSRNIGPSSSASTPLLHTSSSSNNQNYQPSSHNLHLMSSRQFTPKVNHSFTPQQQLPPLHLRALATSNNNTPYSSNLLSSPTRTVTSPLIPMSSSSPSPFLNNGNSTTKVIETVSLKGSPSLNPNYDKDGDIYYIRNLAITDTYTFQDLLLEIDFAGSPPPGKKVIISDLKRERIFPLGQAIRSVIRYPTDTHVEFYLDLSEKPSIDWNTYK
ncbi:MAG: hypothetical protein EXX96DRAFT_541405 [Benjaminiella poitrasii]|nr:MAG: hypothetical protein EXX96DRAFT_541405 [Benjaminiella poitrasii]